jgi:hypothetical protein
MKGNNKLMYDMYKSRTEPKMKMTSEIFENFQREYNTKHIQVNLKAPYTPTLQKTRQFVVGVQFRLQTFFHIGDFKGDK